HDDPNELSSWPIEKVMEEAFPRVESLTPISIVSSLLQYAPAVLVTEKGNMVGIITKADLIKVIQ
ncbi:MAG: CBS domain-containing protein, partial [Candidatus Hodarchaeota archaeon]